MDVSSLSSRQTGAGQTRPRRSRIVRTEVMRWLRDPVTLTLVAGLAVLSAGLVWLAVGVAAGGGASGSEGIQLQSDTVLGASSTDADLVSMVQSSLAMLVPIAGIVLGAYLAGSELSSGALLQLAVTARRLRSLFVARTVTLVVLAGVAGGLAALATLTAADAAVQRQDELGHLSAWDTAGSLVAGAVVQAVLVALIAFSLSVLTRRWFLVCLGMLLYLIALEPAVAGLVGGGGDWLPRAATSQLLAAEPDVTLVVPTAVVAVIAAVFAVASMRRDKAAR